MWEWKLPGAVRKPKYISAFDTNQKGDPMSKTLYLDHFNMVGDFHRKFDLPVYDPSKPTVFIDDSTFLFRLDLITEELRETAAAYYGQSNGSNAPIVDYADGCGDLLYVLYGLCHYLNFQPTPDRSIIEYPAKAGFNDNHEDVFVPAFLDAFREVHDGIAQIIRGHRKKDFRLEHVDSLPAGINWALCYTLDLTHLFRVPIDRVFREIHRANMSKVRSTGDDDSRSVRGSKFDVVKPANFVPPRIAEVLNGTV
jgi:predicted HAD superfamily Cof-like phosphohydrolase